MKFQRTINNYLYVLLITVFIFSSCGKDEIDDKRSMEQRHQEEGLPVEIQEIQYKPFEKSLTFFATLKGVKESQKNSSVADRCEKINFKVGDYVKEKQIVMTFPTDNPTLQFSQAKAALENSERLYNRTKVLFEAGETSQANFEAIETQYTVNKRNYESLKQILFVEAPISGRLVELFIKEGDPIDHGKPLFTIAQVDKLRAKLWVSQEEVNQLKIGMTAELNYNNEKYLGRVSEISLSMDNQFKAFGVEIIFENYKMKLSSGITAEVSIKTFSNPKAIILPRNLILNENEKHFVYVLNGDKASKREVELGLQNNMDFEIKSGLSVNEKIIVTGLDLLSDGLKIKISK